MKTPTLSIALAAFLVMASAHAECRLNANDPFEPNGGMPSGPFKGKCLVTEERRSFRVLTLEEAAKVVPAGELNPDLQWVANVNHQGKFWVAGLPKKDGIADIVFQVEHFPPEVIAAHTELRINFKPDRKLRLYPQVGTAAPVELSAIILSVEAVPMRGGPTYDLIKGVQGYFGIASRLVSLEDKVAHIVFDARDTTDQYLLKIKGDELDRFWQLALARLNDPEMQNMYDTLRHSCTNSLFEVLDEFQGRTRGWRNRAVTAMPILAKQALEYRSLIDETLPTLNEEFHGPAKEKKKCNLWLFAPRK